MMKNIPERFRWMAPRWVTGAALLAAASLPAADSTTPPLGMPLRDAAITIVDGTWYLTGTAGTYDKTDAVDFDYNGGTPLWRSPNGEDWERLGLVWDRAERFEALGGGQPSRTGKWIEWTPPGERLDALLANATTTPSIYRHEGSWYLLSAQNQRNVFVFKSTTEGPEGPYANHANLATDGGFPSFFFDDDGSVYLVLADGWIAPVKPDLSGLRAPIRRMKTAVEASGRGALFLGDRGISLFKRNGRYHALGARWTVRDGKPSHDAFLWVADAPTGPFHPTGIVLRGTGPVRAFQTPGGNWHAVSSHPVEANPVIQPIPAADTN